MAHNRSTTRYTERIELEQGKIYRIVTAYYKNEQMDILKQEFGSEDVFLRNMTMYGGCGWLYISPNDRNRYGSGTYGVDHWYKSGCNCYLTADDCYQDWGQIEGYFILIGDLNFIYTLRTMDYSEQANLQAINEMYMAWKRNPACEMLFKLGYNSLAKDKKLAKMSKNKQKEIMRAIKELNPPKSCSLIDLLIMKKHNCDYITATQFGGDTKLKNYLLKENESYSYYKDYIVMAKELGKDLNDHYWKYPKNLREAHNKCVNELQEIARVQRELAIQKEQERKNSISKAITKIAEELENCTYKSGQYEIYLPKDLQDINDQASELSQCLISCKYYEMHADRELTLVFIKKDNERFATAEIKENGSLGQFYGDERDRDNCKPEKEARKVLTDWLRKYRHKLVTNMGA